MFTCGPAHDVLYTTQNRLREKRFFTDAGIPCAPFAEVNSLDELEAAILKIGLPCVLKTANSGYDGKGQITILRERGSGRRVGARESATRRARRLDRLPARTLGLGSPQHAGRNRHLRSDRQRSRQSHSRRVAVPRGRFVSHCR